MNGWVADCWKEADSKVVLHRPRFHLPFLIHHHSDEALRRLTAASVMVCRLSSSSQPWHRQLLPACRVCLASSPPFSSLTASPH
jgi:hypothetical protein